jgi:hypothetical protein
MKWARTLRARANGLSRHSFALDVALLAVTMLLPWDPVHDWLSHHQTTLHWCVGITHIVYVPFMLLQLVNGPSRAGEVLFSPQEQPHSRPIAWVSVLFLCTSFMVPFVVGLPLGRDLGLGVNLSFVFGPFVLLGLAMWASLRLEARIGYQAATAFFARPIWGVATFVLTWGYLTTLESTLFVTMGLGGIWSGGLCATAAILSYLPVRLFVFYFRSTESRDMALLWIAFGHFFIRLMLAAPS